MKNDLHINSKLQKNRLQSKPPRKKQFRSRKSLSVYKPNIIKKSIREFRDLNRKYFRSEKKSQKGSKGTLLQVKAPDGSLSIKRIMINDKIPEQVDLKGTENNQED
jgi:hypothetical protein